MLVLKIWEAVAHTTWTPPWQGSFTVWSHHAAGWQAQQAVL